MSNQYQRIFKYSVVERLHSELKYGNTLKQYFEQDFELGEDDSLNSTIEIDGKLSLLVPKKDLVGADLENSKRIYGYYKGIDETQASDPRLWTYLSHVEFRKYSLARWGLEEKYKDIKNEQQKTSAINQLLEHWFVSGNDRDLRRHSIARLWWAAHLTYAPWDRDPEYFSGLKKKDPYYYTSVLFFTQDIYQQVLERAMGRSSRILITVLDFLANNVEFAETRNNVRNLMKELNLIYGTKKIIALSREQLAELVARTANEIDRQAVSA